MMSGKALTPDNQSKQTPREWWWLVLCLAAYLLAVGVAERVVPVARWHVTLDRAEAIKQAQTTLDKFGIETRGWQAFVENDYNARSAVLFDMQPAARSQAAMSPMWFRVQLYEPVAPRREIAVELSPQGKPLSVRFKADDVRRSSRNDDEASASPEPSATNEANSNANAQTRTEIKLGGNSNQTATENAAHVEQDEATLKTPFTPQDFQIGDAALAKLLGDEARNFKFVAPTRENERRGRETENITRLSWEQPSGFSPDAKTEATVRLLDGELREVAIFPNYGGALNKALQARLMASNVFQGIVGAMISGLLFFVLALLLNSFVRKDTAWRAGSQLGALVFIVYTLSQLFADDTQRRFVELVQSDNALVAWLKLIFNTTIEGLLVGFGFGVLWSVTFPYARRHTRLKISSLTAVTRGKLNKRFVGASVWRGVVCGGLVIGAQYLLLTVVGTKAEVTREGTLFVLTSATPALTAFTRTISLTLILVFGGVVPYLADKKILRRAARPLVWLIAFALFGQIVAFTAGWWTPAIVLAVVATLDWIYRKFDLLTAMVALFAASVFNHAMLLFATANNTHDFAAYRTLGLLMLFGGVGLAINFYGRAGALENEIEPDTVDRDKVLQAERERLVAEFDIAHQAQQRMLPERPPKIDGYEIAAVCRPAREVGGDLYDFIKLPDERIGIVVADVSGKGVPAALYMTLTKGLLASIAEHESAPEAILCEANKHLYEVCRRKTFVTLVLAVLDPPTRTLTLARAGHNPPVWRQSRPNIETLLKPSGLGLGLNKGKLFDATLKPQVIKLETGDAMVFYSDGITEAMNRETEEYGETRLMQVASRCDGLTAQQTQQEIMQDVGAFLDDVHPQDDQTVVVLRVV